MSSIVAVRVDDELKQQAEATVSEMGLTLTSAVTVFLKAMVRQRRIPFDMTADPCSADGYYNPANRAVLDRSIAAANHGKFEATTTLADLERSET